MPLKIIRHDITKMQVDVIVNAANSSLQMGGGVCGAIFNAAGSEALQKECDTFGHCNVGEAIITSGHNLSAKRIIHTVGPVWQSGVSGEERLLYNCYSNSLKLAAEFECNSIAFPLISSGVYGYPKEQALKVANSAIKEFLNNNEMMVYLVVFDKKSVSISEKLYTSIKQYIDDNYVDENLNVRHSRRAEYDSYISQSMPSMDKMQADEALYTPSLNSNRKIEDVIGRLEETFSEMLLRMIDEKGITDPHAYKKANIDRKLFSKIKSNKHYNPSKITAISFSIALELSLDETLDILKKAGFTLSHSNHFDIIVEYCIDNGIYNIFEINEILFEFDQVLLSV